MNQRSADQSSDGYEVRNTPTSWMHANGITSDWDVGPQLDTAPLISDSTSKIRPVAHQFPLRGSVMLRDIAINQSQQIEL